MSRADYAHWNEEADQIWWAEEGRHQEEYDRDCEDDRYAAEEAFAEELSEVEDDDLYAMLADVEYLARWPRAKRLIEWEIKYRGLPTPDEVSHAPSEQSSGQ